MKKVLLVAVALLVTATVFNSCKKDNGDPPVLPPAGSMVIDFSNFASGKKSVQETISVTGTENSNWEYSAVVVGFWNLILATQLAVPVASFSVAVDQTPVFIGDKTWQWSYSVPVAAITYKARLTGQIAGDKVNWKMYLSREGTGGFAEFIWFEGTSDTKGSSGQWILKQSAAVQENYLQIDWTKSGTTVGSIKYTYLKNDSFKTSYIEYGLTTATLNAFFNVHYFNGAKFSDVNIEWNTTTKNGRVKSVDYLGDSNWYCWDSNRVNATCL